MATQGAVGAMEYASHREYLKLFLVFGFGVLMVSVTPFVLPPTVAAFMHGDPIAMTLMVVLGFFFLIGGFVLILTAIVGSAYRFRQTT